MRVREYREVVAGALQLVTDWNACVDDDERNRWRDRASRYRPEFDAATCSRATARDLERYALAQEQLSSLLAEPVVATPRAALDTVTPARTGGQSCAAKYNGSASRAVRLGRAARSAMRRG